jgi:hypothetical protein
VVDDLLFMALLRRPEFLDPQTSGDDLGGHAKPATVFISKREKNVFTNSPKNTHAFGPSQARHCLEIRLTQAQ